MCDVCVALCCAQRPRRGRGQTFGSSSFASHRPFSCSASQVTKSKTERALERVTYVLVDPYHPTFPTRPCFVFRHVYSTTTTVRSAPFPALIARMRHIAPHPPSTEDAEIVRPCLFVEIILKHDKDAVAVRNAIVTRIHEREAVRIRRVKNAPHRPLHLQHAH